MTTTPDETRDDQDTISAQLGIDRLVDEAQELSQAIADRGVSSISNTIDSLTDRLTAVAAGSTGGEVMTAAKEGSKAKLKTGAEAVKSRASAVGHGTTDEVKHGASAVRSKLGSAFKGEAKGKSHDKKLKVTNIVEEVDVPVDRKTAYELWTQFEKFPSFMKKVENVKQKTDATVEWTAQVLWSQRSWTAKIVDQVPGERIVWHSKGDKGYVNGAVTFHDLAPDLTRILLTLEYHPSGLFEHTGNIWRAQGRRARLELKHFRRHVSTHALIHPDEIEGWTGEIHKGRVQSRSGRKRTSKTQSSRSGGNRSSTSKSTKSRTGKKASASSRSGAGKATKSAGSRSTAKKTTKKRTPAKR
jgi:uncharacterized membrane protein